MHVSVYQNSETDVRNRRVKLVVSFPNYGGNFSDTSVTRLAGDSATGTLSLFVLHRLSVGVSNKFFCFCFCFMFEV